MEQTCETWQDLIHDQRGVCVNLGFGFSVHFAEWDFFSPSDPFKPFIIFSNRHEIRRIDLHKGEFSVLVPGLRNTIALDFHLNQSTLYWTDVVEDKIYRGKLSDNGGELACYVLFFFFCSDFVSYNLFVKVKQNSCEVAIT